MALPKKGLRKITVGATRFAWSATGNDDFISLYISPLDINGQSLRTSFDYHSILVSEEEHGGVIARYCKQQLKVTPCIVRQVIDYALIHGWQPLTKTGELWLPDIEKHIDLRLKGAS